MPQRFCLLTLLVMLTLLHTGCWQRVAIARGVQRVESGDGPVGQMVDQLGDGVTDTSGNKTTATTSDATVGGNY